MNGSANGTRLSRGKDAKSPKRVPANMIATDIKPVFPVFIFSFLCLYQHFTANQRKVIVRPSRNAPRR